MSRRGIAPISVFLTLAVVMMMVGAIMAHGRNNAFRSRNEWGRQQALFAPETGLAEAVYQLEKDRSWKTGFTDQATPFGQGSYSLRFDTSGSPGPDDSVENFGGTVAVAGPDGPATVPPGTAVLVCTGAAGGTTRRVTAVVGAMVAGEVRAPVLVSGRIDARGNTRVDGLAGVTGDGVQTVVHTNTNGTPGASIQWSKALPADRLEVDGKLTAVDNRDAALVFSLGSPSDYNIGGAHTNAPQMPMPKIDIAGTVLAQSGATLSGPVTVLSAGKHFLSSPPTYDGRLVLAEGAG